jgi:hypothetical protein
MSNRSVFATDSSLGFPSRSELEIVFNQISSDTNALVQDLRDMDVELHKCQHTLNAQAYIIDAMTKILVSKDVCTAEELTDIMKQTHAIFEALTKAITGQAN